MWCHGNVVSLAAMKLRDAASDPDWNRRHSTDLLKPNNDSKSMFAHLMLAVSQRTIFDADRKGELSQPPDHQLYNALVVKDGVGDIPQGLVVASIAILLAGELYLWH